MWKNNQVEDGFYIRPMPELCMRKRGLLRANGTLVVTSGLACEEDEGCEGQEDPRHLYRRDALVEQEPGQEEGDDRV